MQDLFSENYFNLEAEQSTLGAMTLSEEAVIMITQLLRPEHFYDERNKVIYQSMLEIVEDNKPADYVTLTKSLRCHKLLTKAGGISYITSVMHPTPSFVNGMHYAIFVYQNSMLRELIRWVTSIPELSGQDVETLESTLEGVEKKIFDVSQKLKKAEGTDLKTLIDEAFQKIEEAYDRSDRRLITGVPSGFKQLDLLTSGFQKSELIILAARASQGKTTFALNLAVNAAKGGEDICGVPVAFLSLQLYQFQIVLRMLCAEARISINKLGAGRLWGDDWPKLMRASSALGILPIFIEDDEIPTLAEVENRLKIPSFRHPIKFAIIDNLQHISLSEDHKNNQETIGRYLKGMARRLEIPIMVLSDIDPIVDRRPDKRPRLEDLRGACNIGKWADQVIFLHRDDEKQEKPGLTEVIVAKNRNGPLDTVELQFEEEFLRFKDFSHSLQQEFTASF